MCFVEWLVNFHRLLSIPVAREDYRNKEEASSQLLHIFLLSPSSPLPATCVVCVCTRLRAVVPVSCLFDDGMVRYDLKIKIDVDLIGRALVFKTSVAITTTPPIDIAAQNFEKWWGQ